MPSQLQSKHSFHIPVMGLGYTIDTPIKVAKYGISSVISIVQDDVVEKSREYYSKKYGYTYSPITKSQPGYRSERIRTYLNLVEEIVSYEIKQLKGESSFLDKYRDLLPLNQTIEGPEDIVAGAIDVNLMTKLDRQPSHDENALTEACEALKGFAESELESSVILSAGLNPRLFSALEAYDDFFPNREGVLKKRIIIKVSDYRSALIQGKMLAKKGLWVSEFRIESGLNCGGHAFATEGNLLGPVLEDFKQNRDALNSELESLCQSVWNERKVNKQNGYSQKITVQGGLGNSNERRFMHDFFEVDATGWGSPFLLVPEATSIDDETLETLKNAGEDDLYVSNISPLGVKFNSIRNSTGEKQKRERVSAGKPGSPCKKKHLALSQEYGDTLLCTASTTYQKKKIGELKKLELTEQEYDHRFNKIVDKECICDGLAVPFLKKFNLTDKNNYDGVTICPGPNLAYFNNTYTLKEMVDHIYGKRNIINLPRPNVFIKELDLYTQHLIDELEETGLIISKKIENHFTKFKSNLLTGIVYYRNLVDEMTLETTHFKESFLEELDQFEQRIQSILIKPSTQLQQA